MMGFVEHERQRAPALQGRDDLLDTLTPSEGIERLIGCEGQFARFGKVVRNRRGGRRFIEEERAKPLNPLVADRDGRCEDERRPAYPMDDFQSEHRFPGPRCSHDMQSSVIEMAVHLVECASLIISPFAPEPHLLDHRFELRGIAIDWQWSNGSTGVSR
ncbi:MAG: hypothetical protein V4618_05800 [Pseudomonadota bacterium]